LPYLYAGRSITRSTDRICIDRDDNALDAILVRLSAPTSGAHLNHEAKMGRNEGKVAPLPLLVKGCASDGSLLLDAPGVKL
jgi:hypothetical protein